MEWNEYNCGYGEYGMFGDEAHAAGAAYEAITEPSHTFTAFHLHSDVQHWGIRASAHFSRMVATGACADALLTPVQRTLSIVTDAVHTAVAAREATSIEVYVVGIGAATALIIRDNGIPFTMSRLQTQLSAGYLTAAHDVVIEWGDTIIGVTKGLPPPSPSSDGAPRVTQGLRHISDDDATDDMTTEQFVMLGEGACVEAIVLFVTSWLAESHHPVNLGVGTTMFDVVDDTPCLTASAITRVLSRHEHAAHWAPPCPMFNAAGVAVATLYAWAAPTALFGRNKVLVLLDASGLPARYYSLGAAAHDRGFNLTLQCDVVHTMEPPRPMLAPPPAVSDVVDELLSQLARVGVPAHYTATTTATDVADPLMHPQTDAFLELQQFTRLLSRAQAHTDTVDAVVNISSASMAMPVFQIPELQWLARMGAITYGGLHGPNVVGAFVGARFKTARLTELAALLQDPVWVHRTFVSSTPMELRQEGVTPKFQVLSSAAVALLRAFSMGVTVAREALAAALASLTPLASLADTAPSHGSSSFASFVAPASALVDADLGCEHLVGVLRQPAAEAPFLRCTHDSEALCARMRAATDVATRSTNSIQGAGAGAGSGTGDVMGKGMAHCVSSALEHAGFFSDFGGNNDVLATAVRTAVAVPHIASTPYPSSSHSSAVASAASASVAFSAAFPESYDYAPHHSAQHQQNQQQNQHQQARDVVLYALNLSHPTFATALTTQSALADPKSQEALAMAVVEAVSTHGMPALTPLVRTRLQCTLMVAVQRALQCALPPTSATASRSGSTPGSVSGLGSASAFKPQKERKEGKEGREGKEGKRDKEGTARVNKNGELRLREFIERAPGAIPGHPDSGQCMGIALDGRPFICLADKLDMTLAAIADMEGFTKADAPNPFEVADLVSAGCVPDHAIHPANIARKFNFPLYGIETPNCAWLMPKTNAQTRSYSNGERRTFSLAQLYNMRSSFWDWVKKHGEFQFPSGYKSTTGWRKAVQGGGYHGIHGTQRRLVRCFLESIKIYIAWATEEMERIIQMHGSGSGNNSSNSNSSSSSSADTGPIHTRIMSLREGPGAMLDDATALFASYAASAMLNSGREDTLVSRRTGTNMRARPPPGAQDVMGALSGLSQGTEVTSDEEDEPESPAWMKNGSVETGDANWRVVRIAETERHFCFVEGTYLPVKLTEEGVVAGVNLLDSNLDPAFMDIDASFTTRGVSVDGAGFLIFDTLEALIMVADGYRQMLNYFPSRTEVGNGIKRPLASGQAGSKRISLEKLISITQTTAAPRDPMTNMPLPRKRGRPPGSGRKQLQQAIADAAMLTEDEDDEADGQDATIGGDETDPEEYDTMHTATATATATASKPPKRKYTRSVDKGDKGSGSKGKGRGSERARFSDGESKHKRSRRTWDASAPTDFSDSYASSGAPYTTYTATDRAAATTPWHVHNASASAGAGAGAGAGVSAYKPYSRHLSHHASHTASHTAIMDSYAYPNNGNGNGNSAYTHMLSHLLPNLPGSPGSLGDINDAPAGADVLSCEYPYHEGQLQHSYHEGQLQQMGKDLSATLLQGLQHGSGRLSAMSMGSVGFVSVRHHTTEEMAAAGASNTDNFMPIGDDIDGFNFP